MAKRFISYFFTYVLVTVLAVVAVACVYFMLDGSSLAAGTGKCEAQVISSKNPVVMSDRVRGLRKDTYRVSYVQEITVKYTYEGVEHRVTKQITYFSEKFDYEPNISGLTAQPKFKDGDLINIYVFDDNPDYFDVENRFIDEGEAGLISILKIAVPIYVVVLLLFTISFVQKEKAAKKQAFYDQYMRDRY